MFLFVIEFLPYTFHFISYGSEIKFICLPTTYIVSTKTCWVYLRGSGLLGITTPAADFRPPPMETH